jgi:mannosyltransferase
MIERVWIGMGGATRRNTVDIGKIDILAPNLKKRMSGVTSTVFRLVPVQARSVRIAAVGPAIPDEIPQVSLGEVLLMPRNGPSGARIWHARRNVEMIAGILLKFLLFKRLRLVFTSAAQRRHKPLTKWLIRRMDRVIATSSKSAGFLDVPNTVIHHGIDTALFNPAGDKAEIRRRLGLPETDVLVGCFGRVRYQKGNDLFVDTMIRLLPDRPDVVAVMMGGVTDENRKFADDLAAKAREAGLADRIHFLPEEKHWDISPWFKALDLYIAPQRWEGFGLTPLEAMACGVPVVATRAGAFEDLIADGQTGRLVDIGDVDALTEATAGLLDDPRLRAEWSANAVRRVGQNFRIEIEADAIAAVYRDLLKAS